MTEKSKFTNFSYFFLLTMFLGLVALTILNLSGINGTISLVIVIWLVIIAFVWYFISYSKFPLFNEHANLYAEFETSEDELRFCFECGAPAQAEQTVCKKCGAKLIE